MSRGPGTDVDEGPTRVSPTPTSIPGRSMTVEDIQIDVRSGKGIRGLTTEVGDRTSSG